MDINLETFISPITKSIFSYTVITGETVRVDDAYNLSPELITAITTALICTRDM